MWKRTFWMVERFEKIAFQINAKNHLLYMQVVNM